MEIKLSSILPALKIIELYDLIVKTMGRDPEKCKYDCTKVWVSKDVADAVEKHYAETYDDWKMKFGMEWCCFGPKVDDTLQGNTVRVEEGFICN